MDLVEVKEHKIEVVVNLNLVGTFPKVNGETKDQLTPNQDKSQNSCGSYGHLQAEYQHRFEPYYEVQDFEPKDEQVQREEVEPEEVYTAFNRFEVFAAAPGTIDPNEVFACVVLDTGCVKTVCGEGWFNDFVSTLSKTTKDQIKVCPSDRNFKFGRKIEIALSWVLQSAMFNWREKHCLRGWCCSL